jgi:hypothetical protein
MERFADGVSQASGVAANGGAAGAPGDAHAAHGGTAGAEQGGHAHGGDGTAAPPAAAPMMGGTHAAAFCGGVAERHRAACWWYVPSLFESNDPAAWPAAARVCERAPADVRRTCYRGVGNQLGGLTTDEPARASTVCATVPADARDACIAGAAEQQVDMDWSGAGARRFCAGLAAGDVRACTTAAMTRLALAAADERTARARCGAAGTGAAACLAAWRALRASRR